MSKSPNMIVQAVVLAGVMALMTGISAGRAYGDVLSLHAFGSSSDAGDADNYASSDADVHTAAGDLVRGPGYGTGATASWPNVTSATFYTGTNWVLRRKSQPTYTEAVNDGDYLNDYERAYTGGTNYLQWTITPQAGYAMNLSSFSLDVTTSNSRFFYYYLSSDIDGYNVVIDAVGGVEVSSATVVVSLAGTQFQNLTSPVTFRLWTWGNQSGSSGSAWSLDNMTTTGTTAAIPEPATLALLGLGGLLMIKRGRSH